VPGQPYQGEREVAQGLLDRAARQQVLRPGLVVLADKGRAGRAFAQTVAELDAVLVRPDRADEPTRLGNLGGVRQWLEAIIDTLKDQLSLERHGAHTVHGVWLRVAQRLLAWPARSGSTGSSTPRSSARWSPMTTDTTHQSASVI
jgi:hypothetical protein